MVETSRSAVAAMRRPDNSLVVGYIENYRPSQLAIDCRSVLEANPELRPMGARSIGYMLMGWPSYQGWIAERQRRQTLGKNKESGKTLHMQRVKDAVIEARRGRFIPFGWIFDQKAIEADPPEYASLNDWLDLVRQSANQFQLERQDGQDQWIEVWTEAASTVVVIERIAFKYGVSVYSSGGYNHLTGIYSLAERARKRDVPTLVLHLGDADKHGRDIYSRFLEDVQAFNPDVNFERIAVTEEQIVRLPGLSDRVDADGHLQLEGMIEHLQPEVEAVIRRNLDLAVYADVMTQEEELRHEALQRLDGNAA